MNANSMTCAISLMCVVTLAFGEDHRVTLKQDKKPTLCNAKMDHVDRETVDAETLQSSGGIPVIVSKTFLPPAGKNFGEFLDSSPRTFVDVLDNMDGFKPFKAIDTKDAVKVSVFVSTTNAAVFPLAVEGILKNAGGPSSKPSTPAAPRTPAPGEVKFDYWSVQVPKDKKMIALGFSDKYVLVGEVPRCRAYAMENLKSQDNVPITFRLSDDKGRALGDEEGYVVRTELAPGGTADYSAVLPYLLEYLPKAPAGAALYIVEASSPGYKSAKFEFIVYKARWIENTEYEYQGYDSMADPADLKRPQLVVGKGIISKASLLKLAEAVPDLGLGVTANAQLISPNPPQTSETATATHIKGLTAGVADAVAKKGETTSAEMKVTVMEEIVGLTVEWIYVKDKAGPNQHSGELTVDERIAAFNGAKDIWLNQVVYKFKESSPPSDSLTLAQAMGNSVTLAEARDAIKDRPSPPEGTVYVYVFWKLVNPNV